MAVVGSNPILRVSLFGGGFKIKIIKRINKRINKILKEIKNPNKTREEKRELGKKIMMASPLLIIIPWISGLGLFFIGLIMYIKNRKRS